MSVSEFSPPPSPKSPASSVSSLSDVSSEAHSQLFLEDREDVGTIAGYTDLNTTVVSDSKLPIATWESESTLDPPIEEEESQPPSPTRSRRRSSGVASTRYTLSRASTRKSTPKPVAAELEFVAFDHVEVPEDLPQPRTRQGSARKRTRSSAGLGREPVPTYQGRTRKVSTRSYRRSSGEPRMNQVPVSRDFFLIFGLCVVLACALIVMTRPAISAVYT